MASGEDAAAPCRQLCARFKFRVYFRAVLRHFIFMQVILDIPDPLAKKFFSTTSARRRSSTVARLLRAELRRRMTAACLAANRDAKLNRDIEDWQSFDEPVVETVEP